MSPSSFWSVSPVLRSVPAAVITLGQWVITADQESTPGVWGTTVCSHTFKAEPFLYTHTQITAASEVCEGAGTQRAKPL